MIKISNLSLQNMKLENDFRVFRKNAKKIKKRYENLQKENSRLFKHIRELDPNFVL